MFGPQSSTREPYVSRAERSKKCKTWDQMDWSTLVLPSLTSEMEHVNISGCEEDSFSHLLSMQPSPSRHHHQHGRNMSMNNLDFGKRMDSLDSFSVFESKPSIHHSNINAASNVSNSVASSNPSGTTSRRTSSFLPPTDESSRSNGLHEFDDGLPEMNIDDIPMRNRPKLRRSVTFAGDLPKVDYFLRPEEDEESSSADSMSTIENTIAAANEVSEMNNSRDVTKSRPSLRIDTLGSSSSTNAFVRKAFPKTIFDSADSVAPSPRSHSRAMSESAALFSAFQFHKLAEDSDFSFQNPSAQGAPDSPASSRGSTISSESLHEDHPVVGTARAMQQAPQPTSSTQIKPSIHMGYGSNAPSSSTTLGSQQYQSPRYNNTYPQQLHQQYDHHQQPQQQQQGSNSYYNPLMGMMAPPPMPPPPPPLASMSYGAPAEQIQAIHAMHQQMMMQWMQMQEHHQRLMMMEHQRHLSPQNSLSPSSRGGFQSPTNSMYGTAGGSPASTPSSSKGSRHSNNRPKRQMSALLQRHKNCGYRPTVDELMGHIVEFACDSHGSRLIQYLMENASEEEKQVLVDETLQDGLHLMTDTFGNYVMQNFLVHSTPAQCLDIINRMKGSVLHLSKQAHGCRVVQKAIEVAPPSHRNWLIYEICISEEMIRTCAKDAHATHCLQKSICILQKYRNGQANENEANSREEMKLLKKIELAVCDDVVNLAKHPNASRLVLLILGDCNSSRSAAVAQIIETVQNAFPLLMWDQHGNFCLQHFLDNGSESQACHVQKLIGENVLKLAKHKFGSHLVEKCLTVANQDQVKAIVDQMLDLTGEIAKSMNLTAGSDSDGTVILSLMKDPYANFVVQRAYDVSRGSLRDEVVKQIQSRSKLLSKFTYGRHILSAVAKDCAK